MSSTPHHPRIGLPLPIRTSSVIPTAAWSTAPLLTPCGDDEHTLDTSGGESDSFPSISITTTASPTTTTTASTFSGGVTAPPQPPSTHHHHHHHRRPHDHPHYVRRHHISKVLCDAPAGGEEVEADMLPGLKAKEASNTSSSSGTGTSTSAATAAAAAGIGSPRRASKKTVASTTTTATAMTAIANTRGSPPILMGGIGSGGGASSPASGSGSGSPSTGCVRWCMNVALQSFTGEPWAVTIQPAAEDDCVLNGSFSGSPGDSAILPPSTAPTTTTAAANSIRQQPLQGSGPGNSMTSGGSGSNRSSPVHGPGGTRMSPSMLRSGLQLAAIDYSEPQVQYPGGPVLDAAMFGYDPQSEETAALHQCVVAVNSPPVTYGVDDLLGRITNVEFIAEQSSPEETAAGVPMHYRLASSLEPMLNATLNPAVTAVVDHCVSSIVLVYGATQEMKQMGLIGTPEECGLLPHGIRTMMDRYLERKEHQQSKVSSSNGSPKSSSDKAATAAGGTSGSGSVLASPPLKPSGSRSPPHGGVDDAASDGDHTEGGQSRSATSQAYSFVFPSIGSRHHRFVRMESTFIAFDSTSVVDLLDLSNKRVELVLKLAPPPTPSAFEEKNDDVNAPSSSSATTDSFVLNARAMPVENTNDALSALDVGLENLSRALELSLLQSESGSSLLFSLTAFTDTCRCATMHVLCLAEDPAAQTWLASTVQARSQAIPLGEEQSWASIQNTPMPPPLHHHAATMLVPALCFGNMFTSVLICVYNSITALSRLNRDLTFAVTGYRMRTIPRVTLASSRRGLKKLPPSWEEYFTNDGRRYFIDTTTQTTTWEDPRLTYQQRSSRSGGSGGGGGASSGVSSAASSGSGTPNAKGSSGPQHRPSRIGLGSGDKDFLANRLQQELHSSSSVGSSTAAGATPKSPGKVLSPLGSSASPSASSPAAGDEPLDIGIVVVDTMCRPRVLIGSNNPRFAQQYVEQERILRRKQHELEEAMETMRRETEAKRAAAAAAAATAASSNTTTSTTGASSGGGDDTDPIVVPVTATPSESVHTIADPAAPARTSDVNDLPLSPVSGLIGLDDVDDEEVSSLCRSSSGNVDDFVFDDESDEEGGGGAQAPLWGGTAASSAAKESGIGSNAEARFYANALQEQAVGVAEMTACAAAAAGATPSASTSATVSPLIGSCSSPDVRGSVPGAPDSSLPSSAVAAAVSPEVQDLESLVDEFTTFYRKAYATQQRVAELEAELRRKRAANSSIVLPPAMSAATAGEASAMSELVQAMQTAVAASPSAEVRNSVLPLLSNASSGAGSSAIVAAFQEALRLAAQASASS